MSITHEDLQRARRISRAIQEYLEFSKKEGVRSTDVYPYLAKKGLIEEDRHNGLHLRKFLRKLKENNLLGLIPQCTCNPGLENQFNEWYFYKDNSLLKKEPDEHPAENRNETIIVPAKSEAEIDEIISKSESEIDLLPKLDQSIFTIQQKETRQNYPRAYERWTEKETEILKLFFNMFKRIDKVAKLLKRQPSAVERKLTELKIL